MFWCFINSFLIGCTVVYRIAGIRFKSDFYGIYYGHVTATLMSLLTVWIFRHLKIVLLVTQFSINLLAISSRAWKTSVQKMYLFERTAYHIKNSSPFSNIPFSDGNTHTLTVLLNYFSYFRAYSNALKLLSLFIVSWLMFYDFILY